MTTPLDQILRQIASATEFTTDEVYVYLLLNVYGKMDVDTILKQSKNRSWSASIPDILASLLQSGLAESKGEEYLVSDLDVFHEMISSEIELELDHLKALKDFI